jgi:hypothetical protein
MRLAEQFVFFCAGWKKRRKFTRRLGERRKTILQRQFLLETTPFDHGALLSIPEEGGSATGVHITDKSHWPGGDARPIPFEQVCSGSCSLSQNIELLHDAPSSVAAVVGDAPGHAGALMRWDL